MQMCIYSYKLVDNANCAEIVLTASEQPAALVKLLTAGEYGLATVTLMRGLAWPHGLLGGAADP